MRRINEECKQSQMRSHKTDWSSIESSWPHPPPCSVGRPGRRRTHQPSCWRPRRSRGRPARWTSRTCRGAGGSQRSGFKTNVKKDWMRHTTMNLCHLKAKMCSIDLIGSWQTGQSNPIVVHLELVHPVCVGDLQTENLSAPVNLRLKETLNLAIMWPALFSMVTRTNGSILTNSICMSFPSKATHFPFTSSLTTMV